MNNHRLIGALAAVALLAPLGACSKADEKSAPTAQASNGTLAAELGGAPGLTTFSTALADAGLGDVFDGPGSYTVLAPDDDAFAKLDQGGKTLTDPAHRAELVAVMRGHILPGHLTPEAIRKAVADKKGPVSMRSLDESMVTFTTDGDTIVVTGADGGKARVDGAALVASNGVVLPLDGLVKSPPPVSAEPS
ncbi:hypothetical protein GCM10011515_18000 [Tsuneonella deserti]|uniref:FAS1 domain-containing protein n=1 Tax=Tsuneonella deserti TaxID=2035528 RepID=A0ABQ1S8S7_9SPHN|nr:fasciclin domain-containing protein [Tsuneonella deserti]GGD98557.1 hypothetical protein GCM10011515_18000 [Tsuneonella deserti]